MHFANQVSMLVGASLFAVFATPSSAEGGSFSFVQMGTPAYNTLEHPGIVFTVGPLYGAAAVITSDGGPFGEGDIYSSSCVVWAVRSEDGLELEAPCTFTDPSGDVWYSIAIRKVGDTGAGSSGDGVHEIIGGTGRFEGITGQCPYTVEYLPGNELVVQGECGWRLP